MDTLAARVKDILAPYVGPTVADTCVRATAISLGKTSDEITTADASALGHSIQRLLSPIAPRALIDTICAEVDQVMAA